MQFCMVNNVNKLITMTMFIFLAACQSPRDVDYFMLEAVPINSQLVPHKELTLGIGPVHLPEYLNRPQFVISTGTNQISLDEDHRWAERLDNNILRVLVQNVSTQLASEKVLRHPWPVRQPVDYQVMVDILEMHQEGNSGTLMQLIWQVKKDDLIRTSRLFRCVKPMTTGEAAEIANAQSQCLADLTLQIVATLQEMTH